MILNAQQFELRANIVALSNLVGFFLVIICTFLGYDSEPTYPEVKSRYEYLVKEAARLAAERKENLDTYNSLQLVYVEAAQELDEQYRKSLQNSKPDKEFRIITENIRPEFKTVELQLKEAESMSNYVSV
jgi:hypothetical protein